MRWPSGIRAPNNHKNKNFPFIEIAEIKTDERFYDSEHPNADCHLSVADGSYLSYSYNLLQNGNGHSCTLLKLEERLRIQLIMRL